MGKPKKLCVVCGEKATMSYDVTEVGMVGFVRAVLYFCDRHEKSRHLFPNVMGRLASKIKREEKRKSALADAGKEEGK